MALFVLTQKATKLALPVNYQKTPGAVEFVQLVKVTISRHLTNLWKEMRNVKNEVIHKAGLEPVWIAIYFDSLLIRNRINQWFANEWITIHLPLIFDLIWFWFAGESWFAVDQNQTESKGIKSIWIANRNEWKSKWIVNQSESKSKSNWITSTYFPWLRPNSGIIMITQVKDRIRLFLLGQLINFRNKNSACSVDISQVSFIIDYLRNRFSIRLWKTARGRLFGPYNAIFQSL